MSGNTYVGGTKSNTAYWESNWGINSSVYSDDLSDTSSQISESAVDESEITDVKQRMLKLFEEQKYTDVVFYPKSGRKTTISAHKAILAVGSPLFATMLYGEESENSTMKIEVEISNLPFDAFSCIVRYLYTDEVFFDGDAHAQAILDGANQFEIPSLVQRCKSYFETQELTELNVCSKLQMSVSNKIEVLKERCIEYIQNYTQPVINSADFLRCNSTTVRTICKLQSLALRGEAELLHAVMRWLNNQNVPSRLQLMESLIKCFRFLTFTVTEFGDVMKRYPDLLTSDDGLKIMLYLYNPPQNPDFKSLPTWVNKNCTKRCALSKKSYANIKSPWNDTPVGKVVFPLISNDDSSITQNMSELTSLLQMKCLNGHHQIKAIKLAFQGPVSDKSVIKNIVIRVHVSPSKFNVYEHIEIANSLEVTVRFSRVIKARRGDLVDIEVEAKNMKCYRFLQFDDTFSMPENRHFECVVSSRPKCGKLYFIKEVEYGPQEMPRPPPRAGDNRRRRNMP